MSEVAACHLACRPGFSRADAGSPWSMEARNIASEAVTPWYLPVRIASPSPPIPSLRISRASPISSLHLCVPSTWIIVGVSPVCSSRGNIGQRPLLPCVLLTLTKNLSHAHSSFAALPKPLLVLDLRTGGRFDLGLIIACHYSKNT